MKQLTLIDCTIDQYLQAVLLSFSINIPIFQYFARILSILQRAPYMMYVLNPPVFSIFWYYGQNSVKNSDNSVYLEALIDDRAYIHTHTWAWAVQKSEASIIMVHAWD